MASTVTPITVAIPSGPPTIANSSSPGQGWPPPLAVEPAVLGLPGVQLLVELGEQLPHQGHAAVLVGADDPPPSARARVPLGGLAGRGGDGRLGRAVLTVGLDRGVGRAENARSRPCLRLSRAAR